MVYRAVRFLEKNGLSRRIVYREKLFKKKNDGL